MRSQSRRLLLALVCIANLVLVGRATGSDAAGNNRGLYAYETYSGEREHINLASGNLNIVIPLLSLPGRNGHDLNLSISYNSQRWILLCQPDTSGPCRPHWDWIPAPRSWGSPPMWSQIELGIPLLTWVTDPVASFGFPSCERDYAVIMPDGSTHLFPDVLAQCYEATSPYGPIVRAPQHEHPVGESDDPELMLLDGNAKVLKTKDGATITPLTMHQGTYASEPKIIDSNGNVISYSGDVPGKVIIRDTVGRQVTVLFDSQNPAETKYVEYLDSNGAPRRISVSYVQRDLAPTFSSPSDVNVECSATYPACTAQLLSSVTFPNGLSYTFEYNNFGEMTKVAYPTGGYTRYEYDSFIRLLAGAQDIRQVVAKHVCSKSNGVCSPDEEETTLYAPTGDGNSSNNRSVDVLDPDQNLTSYEFSYSSNEDFQCDLLGGCTGPYDFAPRELVRRIYSGQGTLLRTINTCYDEFASCPRLTTKRSLPVRVTTTLNDTGQVSKTEWVYDTYTPAGSSTSYRIDNVIEKREYAYSLGTFGSPVRTTKHSWLKVNPVNGVDYGSPAIHVLNRVSSEQVFGSDGNLAAQKELEYDNFSEGLTVTGAVQHQSSTARGNLTAVKQWRNTDGAWLVTRSQYDDAGNVRKTTDPAGHSTVFSFTDSWANATCSTGVAASYNTAVQSALGHKLLRTYNSCTGTVASVTDANNQTTTFTYDLMDRLGQSVFPPVDGLRGQVQRTFSDPMLPISITTTTKMDATKSRSITTVLDGLGRVSQTQEAVAQ